MHERPAGERHISELAITIEESCCFDGLPQGVETGATGFVQARMCTFFLDRRAEHQLEEARLLACKHDIGDAQRIERGSGIGRSRSGSAEAYRELSKSVFGHRCKQRLLVGEMTIGSHCGHLGPSRHGSQREPGDAMLRQKSPMPTT